jgi:hypothetical protein
MSASLVEEAARVVIAMETTNPKHQPWRSTYPHPCQALPFAFFLLEYLATYVPLYMYDHVSHMELQAEEIFFHQSEISFLPSFSALVCPS